MKNIFILILTLLFVTHIKAQIIYDEWGDIIPFSLTEKYKDIIKKKDIHSLVLPSFDNDSLCRIYNNGKALHELGNTAIAGFPIDTLVNFKESAISFKIDEGTIWIYTVESQTAGALRIHIKDFDVPEGAYFSIIPGNIPYEIQEPETYIKGEIPDRIKNKGLTAMVYDQKLVIEYFEPINIEMKGNFIIDRVDYWFEGPSKKKALNNNNTENKLKSGGWTSNPALSCQKDVVCPEGLAWQNESKAVVFVRIAYTYNGNPNLRSDGSGYFLNKEGNYTGTEYPIMVTCGHLFTPKPDGVNVYDISTNFDDIDIRVDYENQNCNETKSRYGKLLPGTFNLLDLGDSYNPEELFYTASEDYAVLQTSKNIDKLAKYNILYAGWTTNHNYTNQGYAVIGHPRSDVKKVCIDNDRAWANSDNFGLYLDQGVGEPGLSGSPCFNSTKEVVGWICRGSGDCTTVGQDNSNNHTTYGRFDNLHLSILYLIDPNVQYSSPSSNPAPPAPPSHCNNCMKDGDETEIDCGGSCYPCGMQDVVTLKTLQDIPSRTVQSRYELFAEPNPNTLLALKSGTYTFEAGLHITLAGGFEVKKGVSFSADIEQELMTEPDMGCQSSCIFPQPSGFTPDGDGQNDYYQIRFAFITEYNIVIFDRWGQFVYGANDQPVFQNGTINVWDGTGASSDGYYSGIVTYYDCYGTFRQQSFSTNIYGLKSGNILAQGEILTNKDNMLRTEAEIEVFPNPFKNKITIDYKGDIFPFKYSIIDINGKEIISNISKNKKETIDLSIYSPGTYLINVKAGEYNLIQKLIKK